MFSFELPRVLEVNGTEWEIRTDYRDILKIVSAFEDPNLEPNEKVYICLFILFVDFPDMPEETYGAAFEAALAFIDHGSGKGSGIRTMDWEQDANLIFPAINKAAGCEVRNVPYIHWWTFIGYFMEIKDGVFSTVLTLRSKKAKHKKLEKWEREWWQENIEICKLKQRYSDVEIEEQNRIKALLG